MIGDEKLIIKNLRVTVPTTADLGASCVRLVEYRAREVLVGDSVKIARATIEVRCTFYFLRFSLRWELKKKLFWRKIKLLPDE